MENTTGRKYAAFISYSHADEKVARWLQHKLESYKLPAQMHSEFDNSRYLRPIFRDRSDLNSGVLTDEISSHLWNSKFLILICSPHSANSVWVNREVQTFIEWGRSQYIIPFVIDGAINCHDGNECIPPYLREYVAKFPEKELLCIDIRENGKEQAYIRVISYVLGLEFDELWHRYQRQQRQRCLLITQLLLVIVILFYWFGTPISLSISMLDPACNLPAMRNAQIRVGDVNYKINNSDTSVVATMPGYWRLRAHNVAFDATYYRSIDTVVHIGFWRRQNLQLHLSRDDTFAIYAGEILDEDYLPIDGVVIVIDGVEVGVSDSIGRFAVELPLHQQCVENHILLVKKGYETMERIDECPSRNIVYKLSKLK